MAQKDKKNKFAQDVQIKNRKASHEYHFVDKYIAGVMLKGTEIKSIRMSQAQLAEAHCIVDGTSLSIVNMHIGTYAEASHFNHEPLRKRRLLLNKREIKKIVKALQETGTTIVPLRLFISARGYAKIEIAVAKGKKLFDKRDDLKKKDQKREVDRQMKDF